MNAVRALPYARQTIGPEDIAAVVEALGAPLVTQGPLVEAFEARFAGIVGARHAIAFNSGTAALHGAYAAAGVGRGHKIITSPITFAATANAARYLGAEVDFVDVDTGTALIDPDSVAAAPGHGVYALVPVHFGGQVADMVALSTIAGREGWVVIEDAAHALGASYRTPEGREYQVGACAHSAMCCFSLHAVKHVTTGEGGMVTTNDAELARVMRLFRTHGITRDRSDMLHDEGPWYYEQHDLGYNYRLTEFQSALGMSQLGRLPAFVAQRRAIAAQYDAAFAAVPCVRPLAVPSWSDGSYHLYVIRVPAPARRAVFDGLRAAGIMANVHYVPVYHHPYYQRTGFAGFALGGAECTTGKPSRCQCIRG